MASTRTMGKKVDERILEKIRLLSRHEKSVAIGEIGLDYYWHKEEKEHLLQQKIFRAQMDIAREEKLPFMIHSRDAAKDTLDIVREYVKAGMYGGIIHCFSYSKEIAREYLDMGLYLGIGGVVTFSNGKETEGGSRVRPPFPACPGDRRALSCSGPQQRETEQFLKSAFCGTGL